MVDALITIAIEKLERLGEDELKLLRGAREEVEKLLGILQTIHPHLHDAEVRQFNEPEVGAWLKELKYVAYEVHDVLDEWQTQAQQLWSRQLSASANPVWNFFAQSTCFHQPVLRHTVGKEIQKINDKLDDIDTQSKKFKFLKSANVMGKGTNFPSDIRNDRQTTSSVEEIFGREDEINGIKDKLINSTSCSETSILAVVSIVGPPGVGKTTVAESVFNHGEVKQHFKERIWVCVSDEFDEESIMRKMIEAAKGYSPSASENQEALRKKIADEVLKDKLFLLVLDDVWNEDHRKWDKLFNIIKNCGLRGSRILVTTRSENVCRVMGSAHDMMFQLGSVSSPEDCWSIFESVAFESRDESERRELRMVGEEIVEKCKGVPLAIKTVAGALRTKRTKTDWENVLKSDMWEWHPKSKTGILSALLLTYYHLSPPLKLCFRYCAIYPKDFDLNKDEIVRQWIAHGYISEKKNMDMEDVGENYFDELVARSLFQEPELDEYNNITQCKMHDLIHDLAQFVTMGEFLFIDNENKIEADTQNPPLHCRISYMGSLNNIKIHVEKLRTFILLESYAREIGFQIKEMQLLRVLELNAGSLEILHDDDLVGKLVHLRYLKLSGRQFKALLRSIGKLQNLLYLDLSRTSIEALPESVGMLRKLRHLDLSWNENLKALPSTIGMLTNLRKLNLKRTGLDEIPDCIGKLGLLRYLNLAWTKVRGLPTTVEMLTNLRKMNLEGTILDEIPNCIGKLASLQVLNVSHCQNLEKLPESIEDLWRLQVLDVTHCTKLEQQLDGIFGKMTGSKLRQFLGGSLPMPSPGYNPSSGLFWVTGNHDGSILKLGDLNHLRGELVILNLDMVTSGEEATEAQLHNKNSLTRLTMKWNTDGRGGAKEQTSEDVVQEQQLHNKNSLTRLTLERNTDSRGGAKEQTSEDVLEALRPCPTLPQLWIRGYPGRKVPTWLGDSTELMLTGLQELCLESWDEFTNLLGLDGCTDLSALGNLPELRRLEIWDMPKVRRVEAKQGFPKLEFFGIWNMAEWDWDQKENLMFTFPCLIKLHISDCPKLRSLPPIFSTSLQEIHVGYCPNLESLPQEIKASLKQLKELEIYDCPKLKESCNKKDAQWDNIKHIPNITIDWEDVRRNA